jgi:hypothetical protein
MPISDEFRNLLAWSRQNEDFVIGEDSFSDVQVNAAPTRESFYYFFNTRKNHLIKQFVLTKGKQVDYLCQISLIKKDDKFTPRLSFSVRDIRKKIVEDTVDFQTNIKANISLEECYANFWQLVSYLQSLQSLEIPQIHFSLVTQNEEKIVSAISSLPDESKKKIIETLQKTRQGSEGASKIDKDTFVAAFAKFLTDVTIQNSFLQEIPKIQIATLKSHIAFLKENLDKNETFIQNWIDEDNGKYRFQRCLIFGLEYIDPKREGQISGKKFDVLAEHDLEHHVIFELKSPRDNVFKIETRQTNNGQSTEYHISPELSRAIPEVLGYKKMYEKSTSEEIERIGMKSKKPISKCVIVIGTRKEDPVWKENFECVAGSLNGIELLTYSHLIDRLENSVKNLEMFTAE